MEFTETTKNAIVWKPRTLRVEASVQGTGSVAYLGVDVTAVASGIYLDADQCRDLAAELLRLAGEVPAPAPAPKAEYLRGAGSAAIIVAKPNRSMINGSCEVIDAWGPDAPIDVADAVAYMKERKKCDDGFALYTLAAVVGPKPAPLPLPEREVVVR